MTEADQIEKRALFELERELSEKSLYEFFKASWPILEPTIPLSDNWHLELIAEYLELVTERQIKRLIINVPPRSLKSTLVTIVWPVWEWLSNPSKRKMFASYAQTLSTEHSMARRRLIESDWFQSRWGDRFKLLTDQNAKHYFKNNHTGHHFSTSVGGTATGMGGDDVVIDDPHNTKQAESEAERTTTLNDIDKGLSTRLNDPKTGAIVWVMQRLNEKDATGHALEQNIEGLVHVCLPTIAEQYEEIIFPKSKQKKIRQPGEFLHPDRMGPVEVDIAKRTLGSYGFAGQHQQRPSPAEGGLLKRATWQRFDPRHPPKFEKLIQSWDLRFKRTTSEQDRKGPRGDYVVGGILGKIGAKIYLLDVVRGLWGFGDSKLALLKLAEKWPLAYAKLVENKANGPALVDDLGGGVQGLRLVEPQGDKLQRVEAIVPLHEAGNLYVPEEGSTPWVDAFVEECASFPNAAHDDQVDAYTQGVIHLRDKELERLKALAGMIHN
jgi:predicted phage terminase large subunit-like protein